MVTKRGRPVAQLAPVSPEHLADWRGAMSETGRITGDLVAPATAPDEWEARCAARPRCR